MSKKESKLIYRKRSGEIEGIFTHPRQIGLGTGGQWKQNKGIGGFAYKGIEKFKAEFLMLCLAHNLEKIMKYSSKVGAFAN